MFFGTNLEPSLSPKGVVMFANYRWLRYLAVAGVLALYAYLLTGSASASTTKPCPIGHFCVAQTTSRSVTRVGQTVIFTVTLRNNLNNPIGKLMLRLTTPRQVTVRSASGSFIKHGANQLRWHIAKMQPGETWTVKIKAKVSAPASARVANTAFVFYDGSPWLANRTFYRLIER